MAATVGSEGGFERADMARFRPGGLALLPWTKQMLTVLWSQLRLLVQVIYYTFMSVFQMFRVEVHVRITDESGQHIQHMSAAANPSDSFLFSTLFDGDGGSGLCGDMGDPFTGRSPAEALLSGLRADELHCGLVEDAMFGPQRGWKMGFTGDWNIFCSDPSRKNPGEEDRGSPWSSEEDQNTFEFDNEESRNLWESLSGSSDPYNPFYFSACTSTRTSAEPEDGSDRTSEEVLVPGGLSLLVSRSDSEISWGSSDGSALSEGAERLLEFFSSSDPYDPMCFTACSGSSHQNRPAAASLPVPPAADPRPPATSEEEDEEERLWRSLGTRRDPYHPLNFQQKNRNQEPRTRTIKPTLQERPSTHRHPQTITVPWRRPGKPPQSSHQPGSAHKKVRFSPVVHVHVMRSWPFARQASRKGRWEEMARDRDRFQRRVKEAEGSIGPCLSPAHRRKMRAYLDGALTS